MHPEMLHMLLYTEKGLGSADKNSFKFLQFAFFFICSSIHVIHIKIQLSVSVT